MIFKAPAEKLLLNCQHPLHSRVEVFPQYANPHKGLGKALWLCHTAALPKKFKGLRVALELRDGVLGKQENYPEQYDCKWLFPVSRAMGRKEIGAKAANLPFHGEDLWSAYEVSWLNDEGKPQFALGSLRFSYTTEFIIESKSLKLYLNSFNQSHFSSLEEVKKQISIDLSRVAGGSVQVDLWSLNTLPPVSLKRPQGKCLDDLEIATSVYTVDPSLLRLEDGEVEEETLYTNLMKSNCLVTGQPDWATLWIRYAGPQINHASLLKYIISFRQHAGFHEQCVERIYCDILEHCKPHKLSVYARYTRRGGLDINPFRSNFETQIPFGRLIQQ